MPVLRLVVAIAGLFVLAVLVYVAGAWLRLYGELEGAGSPTEARVPASVVEERARVQRRAAAALTPAPTRQILFGDLHVHTTFSTDAFLWSLPMMQGEGAHPVADACDYARFCSTLDFWSINDHAEASSPRRWHETVEAIRQCDAIAGDPYDPDVAAFLGWEWSQVGASPEDHYGHKNVVLLGLADGEIPTRPIGAAGLATEGLRGARDAMPWFLPLLDFPERQRYYDFIAFLEEVREVPRCREGVHVRELPDDCYESAATPRELFDKLDQWSLDAMVIPHGNTWGFYSPPGISWDKQLTAEHSDPERQFLVEVMSGHGNSEEHREWRAAELGAGGEPSCPEPRADYVPSCWRAGELIGARCLEAGEPPAECASRAADARHHHARAGAAGHLTVPGSQVEDWLDAGQCRDCFLPSFNYRPGGSTQYALAITNFDDPGDPRRFRFGLIASSDNHRARPGTGYKEFHRLGTTEAAGPRDEKWLRRVFPPETPTPRSRSITALDFDRGFGTLEAERQTSFFLTGGLAAVHADGRSRQAIWEALARKEVYGTSGDRILLWFHLLNAEGAGGEIPAVPMGGEVRMRTAPRFEVRAVGSFEQEPGCPEFATSALAPERLDRLCRGECYNPSDRRRLITRIEVVRIRPQSSPGEAVAALIEDPWRVLPCPPSPAGCVVHFDDPEFPASGRDTLYYVRAIQEPTLAVNGGLLRCVHDESGQCVEVRPCYGDYRTDRDDDCLESIEQRAWSSPIFLDYP
jgi:hypothetical protein